jgi:hypothetical protein
MLFELMCSDVALIYAAAYEAELTKRRQERAQQILLEAAVAGLERKVELPNITQGDE